MKHGRRADERETDRLRAREINELVYIEGKSGTITIHASLPEPHQGATKQREEI